jgi:hypothetical protein
VDVNEQVLADRTQEFVAGQGIEFIFETKSQSSKIRAQYSRFLAQNDKVAATLSFKL